MTRSEVGKLLMVVKATYPRHFEKQSIDDLNNMLVAWGHVLSDIDYPTAEAGLMSYMANDTAGFPPSPGQIIDHIGKARKPDDEMSATEAWSLVTLAIRKGIWHSKEAYDELPENVQKAVGSHVNLEEWAKLPTDEVQSVIQSHFVRAYNAGEERRREYAKIPSNVKELIEQTSQKMIEVAT